MGKKKKLAKKPMAKPAKSAKVVKKAILKKVAKKSIAKPPKKAVKKEAAPAAKAKAKGKKLDVKVLKRPAKAPAPVKEKIAKASPSKPPEEAKKTKKKVDSEGLDDFEETDEFGGEQIETDVVVAVEVRESVEEEVVLTDAEGRRYCRVRDCDQIASVDGYCRYHYLLFWKKIQVRKKILAEGKLERYIEDLTARYPDKYLEMLKKDLKSEKDFLAAIQELEIDESGGDGEFEDEAQSYIDEVRGMSETSGAREEEEF